MARTDLGIAGSLSAGLRENFGTMMKPFHAGRAAESGVIAAEFAALGFTATPQILEAPRGFFRAAGGGYDEGAIHGNLGNPWTFANPGVSIKPHPSGSLTHPGMTLMLSLIKQHGIRPDQVERVKVGTNQNMPNALIHHQPRTELQAKFSMEFCMAILLLERKASLPEFTDEVVNRPDVQAMIKKVDFGVHPDAEAAGYDKMTTIIEIALKDGRRISGRADFGKGSPANPMSYEEVADKFRECAAFSRWPRDRAERVIELVRGLEGLRDVRELTALLSRGVDRGGRGQRGAVTKVRAARQGRAGREKAGKKVKSGKRR
jgi:2-methylcitrate dehydratase PrpD